MPGALDLLDSNGFGRASLALVIRMLGHESSIWLAHRRSGRGAHRTRLRRRESTGWGRLARVRTKVILDVDTGTDDAVALMVAALSPDLELIGATTVNGNTAVENCTDNTLRVFDWIGLPATPVHQGMAQPLVRPIPERNPARRFHGDHLDLPVARSARLRPGHAVDWLIDTYLASDGDVTLVPVGPLTNIATAIRKEPRILERIPEIVMMGGAHDHGNTTASAEFNVWTDPEAARIVVNAGRPMRMVSLDATHRALVSLDDCRALRALGSPAGEAASRFAELRIEGYDAAQPMHRAGAAPIHDALAVCAVIDPTVITTRYIPVDVETNAELSIGRTVCDFRFRSGKPANVNFAVDADEARFVAMLLSILGRSA